MAAFSDQQGVSPAGGQDFAFVVFQPHRDFGNRRVCRRKTVTVRLDLHLRLALQRFEILRVPLLDLGASADRLAVVANELAAVGPVRGDRRRIVVIKRLDHLPG
jgi:hypothetical protein